MTTPGLYKETSEKRGVEQGYLRCSADVTNQGKITSATQATVTSTQVSVKYRRNVGSVSIDMSADNRTTTLGRQLYRRICRRDRHIYISRPTYRSSVGRVSVDMSSDVSVEGCTNYRCPMFVKLLQFIEMFVSLLIGLTVSWPL